MTPLEKLRRGLKQRVSQEALARAAGCSLTHYNRIERGNTAPDPALCVRLADALIECGARTTRGALLRHYHPDLWRAANQQKIVGRMANSGSASAAAGAA